jgi:ABC-type transport system involved in multi-copper enzyme maturation permease subunit
MSLIARMLPDNPVLTKEMRVRMRGSRAYWILFGYLGFLTFVLLVAYYAFEKQVAEAGTGASDAARVGAQLFMSVIVTQIFLVLFITPAITSGSITLEKEQRTLDMLTMTRMPRRSIIVGKLLSAVSFTALLLISSLPLVSICFMLGSVDPGMVVSSYMMMLFGSFLVGAMGLMWSSIAKTTTSAVMFTYGTLFLVFVCGAIFISVNSSPFGGSIFVSMIQAVATPLFGGVFLGIRGWDGIGFAVTCTLAGILLAAIAMARLEMFPERKARLLRGLTLLLVGMLALAADIWWVDNWYGRATQALQVSVHPPIAVLAVSVVMLFLLIPAFATGELKPYEARRFGKHLLWGWSPKGLSRGKLVSGLPFLLIVTLVCLAAYGLAFVRAGRAGDIAHSAGGVTAAKPAPAVNAGVPIIVNGQLVQGRLSAGATIVNGRVVMPPPAPQNPLPANYARTVGDFPQAAIMLLAFTLGLALFCMCLSIAFRNRWVAWFLSNMFLLLLLLGPERARQPLYDGMEPGAFINLYYLNPIQSLWQMGEPTSYWAHNSQLAIGKASMWLCVTEGWLLIGALSLLVMLPFVARERKINAEIPYEELVAEA